MRRDDTTDVAALRVEQVSLGDRKDKAAAMFALGKIDEVQLATITARASTAAVTRSPRCWPRPGGGPRWNRWPAATSGRPWAALPLARKRAILGVIADVHVLPTTPTTRGFDPDGVRIEWKVN